MPVVASILGCIQNGRFVLDAVLTPFSCYSQETQFFFLFFPFTVASDGSLPESSLSLLTNYSRLLFTYSLPYPEEGATALGNGFSILPCFSALSSLLRHVSPQQLESLCLHALSLLSPHEPHQVIDVFLAASLSRNESIAAFATQWLQSRMPCYASIEEIPFQERDSYDARVGALLALCQEEPGSFASGFSLNGRWLLPPSVRSSALTLLTRCYIRDEHYKTVLTILVATLGKPQPADPAWVQWLLSTYQFVKTVSQTLSPKTLTLIAKVIYMSMWKTILLLQESMRRSVGSSVSSGVPSEAPTQSPPPSSIRECIETALSLIGVLTRRVPETLSLRCEELRLCVKLLESEASEASTTRSRQRSEPLTVAYYQCFCSLRSVFPFLPTQKRDSILVTTRLLFDP